MFFSGARPARLTLAGVFALALATTGYAADVEKASITVEGEAYAYEFVATLNAPAAEVLNVITDFDALKRLNDHIVDSRILARPADGPFKRLLRIERCILSFCFDLIFVEYVEQREMSVTTTIEPDGSTFHAGTSIWAVAALEDGSTRLSVNASQTPDFWIPPVIGELVLERVFLSEMEETAKRIEVLANTPAIPAVVP